MMMRELEYERVGQGQGGRGQGELFSLGVQLDLWRPKHAV